MKLVVNMVMGTMMASLGEGLALCGAAGMDCEQLLKVLDLGVMSNGMFRLKGPKMVQSDHAPNFPLQHAQKDMRLAGELGAQLGLGLPVAAAWASTSSSSTPSQWALSSPWAVSVSGFMRFMNSPSAS